MISSLLKAALGKPTTAVYRHTIVPALGPEVSRSIEIKGKGKRLPIEFSLILRLGNENIVSLRDAARTGKQMTVSFTNGIGMTMNLSGKVVSVRKQRGCDEVKVIMHLKSP